jgi:DNA-binding PadR family transcriptional regulator
MNDLLLLAMMLDEPKYGYQLKREAGWMTGQEALHNNLVYPMLRRFLEEGWVSKKAVPGERGQIRQQYVLTAIGRRNLFERIADFGEEEAASEAAFYLRVGLFSVLPEGIREKILAARESHLRRREEALEELDSNMELGKFGEEIMGHMTKQIEMQLEWIRHLRRIEKPQDAKAETAKSQRRERDTR